MSDSAGRVVQALNRAFIRDHPLRAAKRIEAIPVEDVIEILAGQPADAAVPLFSWLTPDVASNLITHLPPATANEILETLSPNLALTLLGQFEDTERSQRLAALRPNIRRELEGLMLYPDGSAGRLMDTNIDIFRPDMTVSQAIDRLRKSRIRGRQSLYLVDDGNRLTARVAMQDLAVADPDQPLRDIAEPATVRVRDIAPREEVVEILERSRLPSIPVVDLDDRLVGVVRYAALVAALEETASGVMQTMVGASKDERALSKATFAVLKRQPWLQINLLTAFLAAAVVGLFQNTIAEVTALAVLLPVVAGQSGNAGAQALAVTMRGLALREITVRHWLPVTVKEISVGFMNGIAIAVTCGIGVFIWSGSVGLMAVIASSMVLAMIAAGFAGAIVPIVLKRLGQDPAQSSSIVLTTVTDVAGFFSFLGIATILRSIL